MVFTGRCSILPVITTILPVITTILPVITTILLVITIILFVFAVLGNSLQKRMHVNNGAVWRKDARTECGIYCESVRIARLVQDLSGLRKS
jgi:hypothetical protein